MVMTLGIGNSKNKRNLLKKGGIGQVKALGLEIIGDLKGKPIKSRLESVCLK